MKYKQILPFDQIEYRHLEELVDITEIIDYTVFFWFPNSVWESIHGRSALQNAFKI